MNDELKFLIVLALAALGFVAILSTGIYQYNKLYVDAGYCTDIQYNRWIKCPVNQVPYGR